MEIQFHYFKKGDLSVKRDYSSKLQNTKLKYFHGSVCEKIFKKFLNFKANFSTQICAG